MLAFGVGAECAIGCLLASRFAKRLASVRSRPHVIFLNSGDRSSPRALADGDMSYLVGASSGLGRSDSARLASASYLAAI